MFLASNLNIMFKLSFSLFPEAVACFLDRHLETQLVSLCDVNHGSQQYFSEVNDVRPSDSWNPDANFYL